MSLKDETEFFVRKDKWNQCCHFLGSTEHIKMVSSVLPKKKQATLAATTCQYFTLTADGHKQEGEKRK